jgi:hypothetical protein
MTKILCIYYLIIKSLLTSLCQREAMYPSLVKRGKGRFFNNITLNKYIGRRTEEGICHRTSQ